MKGLNMKEVCRQIKASGRNYLIWSRQAGFHYVTNRIWMIRFTDDQLPREVLVLLFSVFAQIPENGRALIYHTGAVKEREALDVSIIYKSMEESRPGKFTPFTKDAGEKWSMRIIQFGSEFIFLNEEYARMVDLTEKPSCSSTIAPVFFLDGAIVIIPYQNTANDSDITLLNDLISG